MKINSNLRFNIKPVFTAAASFKTCPKTTKTTTMAEKQKLALKNKTYKVDQSQSKSAAKTSP